MIKLPKFKKLNIVVPRNHLEISYGEVYMFNWGHIDEICPIEEYQSRPNIPQCTTKFESHEHNPVRLAFIEWMERIKLSKNNLESINNYPIDINMVKSREPEEIDIRKYGLFTFEFNTPSFIIKSDE